MSAIINQGIIPGIISELMASSLNCDVNNKFNGRNWPKVDIVENDNGYSLKAEVPGMEKSEINMVVEKGILSIEGEKKIDFKQEDGKYCHRERSYGKFSRSFTLPEGIDPDKIEAKLSNGLLEITIPKAEIAKAKSVEIKIG